jgi:phage-related protein
MKEQVKHENVGPGPAIIAWEGDSKELLTDFPEDVKKTLGFSLRQIQNGQRPRCDCRPMDVVGPGVWELKEADHRTWYRVMYLTVIRNVIHVLHCFEKDSRKTDQRDIEIAKSRLSKVRQRLREERTKKPAQ